MKCLKQREIKDSSTLDFVYFLKYLLVKSSKKIAKSSRILFLMLLFDESVRSVDRL